MKITFRERNGRFKKAASPIEKELRAFKVVANVVGKLKPESQKKVLEATFALYGIKP